MQKVQCAEDHHCHEYHLNHHSYCDLSLYKNQIRLLETIISNESNSHLKVSSRVDDRYNS